MLMVWQKETQNISWEPRKEDVLIKREGAINLLKVAERLSNNINLY